MGLCATNLCSRVCLRLPIGCSPAGPITPTVLTVCSARCRVSIPLLADVHVVLPFPLLILIGCCIDFDTPSWPVFWLSALSFPLHVASPLEHKLLTVFETFAPEVLVWLVPCRMATGQVVPNVPESCPYRPLSGMCGMWCISPRQTTYCTAAVLKPYLQV